MQGQTQPPSDGNGGGVAFGDYFIGPSLDLLLQRLVENNPGRYGTPPARKELVEALPTVQMEATSSCPVCLEDLEEGEEAREMPCKHRFHGGCILPWLELYSSFPVCRFQIPADETKMPGEGRGIGGGGERVEGGDRRRKRGEVLGSDFLAVSWVCCLSCPWAAAMQMQMGMQIREALRPLKTEDV